MDIGDIVKSDLMFEGKKTLLHKIKDLLKGTTENVNQVLVTSKNYEEEVEKKIHSMEMIYSGFYGRELEGKDFEYTSLQREKVKSKILSSLPSSERINNI